MAGNAMNTLRETHKETPQTAGLASPQVDVI